MADGAGFVFVSYARADKTRVVWIRQNLAAQGIDYFIDEQMPVAGLWENILQQKIVDCAALLVVWTEKSVASEWVAREVREAIALDKPVVPMRLDQVLPPAEFNHLNLANLIGWEGNFGAPEWRKVIEQLPAALPPLPLSVAALRNAASTVPNQEPPGEQWTLTLQASSREHFDELIAGYQRQGFRPISVSDQVATYEKLRTFNVPLAVVLAIAGIIPYFIYRQVFENTPARQSVRIVRLG